MKLLTLKMKHLINEIIQYLSILHNQHFYLHILSNLSVGTELCQYKTKSSRS